MKKIVFLFGLLFCSSVFAQSNWITVALNSTGNEWFVDVNSIQRRGDLVTFWSRANFLVRDKDGDLSSKSQDTINCRTREQIIRWIMFYDDRDNMGKLTLSSESTASWRPIAPDTISDALRLFVCKYK